MSPPPYHQPTLVLSLAGREPAPPTKIPTRMYCGIASSHHFTSTSPRESRSGYATASVAG